MNILTKANSLVAGDRNDAYGHPADDFARTAAIWSDILGVPVADFIVWRLLSSIATTGPGYAPVWSLSQMIPDCLGLSDHQNLNRVSQEGACIQNNGPSSHHRTS